MSDFGYTFFDTAVGRCSLLWGPRGIVRLQLPERSDEATRARLLRHYPDRPESVPPPAIQRVIDDIGALLAGETPDLASVPLDLDGVAAFNAEVYAIARNIPAGKTLTYGAIAKQMMNVEPGDAGAARAVGAGARAQSGRDHHPLPSRAGAGRQWRIFRAGWRGDQAQIARAGGLFATGADGAVLKFIH